jgi:hypothetical protein
MATWQAVNVMTGTPEGQKWVEVGNTIAIWKVALTTALANGDTILGPTLPANTYLQTVIVDTDQLDTGGTIAFSCGYAGATAAFIAAGNTTAQTGGLIAANVAGTTGFSATTNTQIIVTITRGATTPKAGTMRISISSTANP